MTGWSPSNGTGWSPGNGTGWSPGNGTGWSPGNGTGWVARNGVRIFIALLVPALLAGVMVQRSCSAARTATATAKLATSQAGAAIASGHDAADTIGNRMAGDAVADAITRENDNAIRNARGADAPVDPDAAAAGIRSLCRRAAYRGDPQCVQHADPR